MWLTNDLDLTKKHLMKWFTEITLLVSKEAYKAWNERSENCVVPEHNIQPLFYELKQFPTAEQVHDMLRTAILIVRGCNSCCKLPKHKNGLTFGEFSVLLSDIRKLRHTSILNSHDITQSVEFYQTDSSSTKKECNERLDDQCAPSYETTAGPEVFLGGSCNPTTWRADVAIPTLNRLGVSFYNPQVSEWTPDLLELEHRAKEKAKVLFFVMDSQTRSTAGAIEVSHIAGKNSKHLVLVLLPYQQQQKILNETLTIDEYMDLSRNQLLLKQLVRSRGLPVLDNIPLALEYIKNILSGGSCREHPQNVASRLISVRRTYDRVVDNSNYAINLTQCQKALVSLGYPPGLASGSIIKQILAYFSEVCKQESNITDGSGSSTVVTTNMANSESEAGEDRILITFDKFCILESYLSVLHQEILETSCVSPIKGTNLQQPPIYLTDSPEWSHRIPASPVSSSKVCITSETTVKNLSQNMAQNNASFDNCSLTVVQQCSTRGHVQVPKFGMVKYSASSSKLFGNSIPNNYDDVNNSSKKENNSQSVCCKVVKTEGLLLIQNDLSQNIKTNVEHEQSNSVSLSDREEHKALETRDLYLGGSCWMLTNWRQKYAVPYLKAKNVTFYTSSFHEGIEGTLNVDNVMETSIPDDDGLIFNPAVLDASRVLLFVITNETRSLGAMTMAAHYIGMGYNVVMCVQMLANDCIIRGLQLSSSAVKDYNRGRAYLIDLAKRQGIPVFNDIDAALKCSTDKLRIH